MTMVSFSDGVSSREQCPKCLDTSQDNLVNFRNGTSHCFACGFHAVDGKALTVSKDGRGQSVRQKFSQIPLEAVSEALAAKGINAKVAKAYDVVCGINVVSGQTVLSFPLFNLNREKTAAHYRPVDVQTQTLVKNQWWFLGKGRGGKVISGSYVPVFGSHLAKKGHKTLVVCEGETDTLALASTASQAELDDTLIVGIVGSGNAKKAASWAVSKSFDNVVLAFDNDEAGSKALADFKETFQEKIKVYTPRTDISDAVKSDELTLNKLLEAACESTVYTVNADTLADAAFDLMSETAGKPYVAFEFCPTLSDKVGFRPGRLVGILGDTGKGKSTVVEHITLDLLKAGKRVLFLSAEMLPHEVLMRLGRTEFGDKEDKESFTKKTKKLVKGLSFVNTTQDDISADCVFSLEKALLEQNSMADEPIEYVVVDHLAAVVPGLEAQTMENVCKSLHFLSQKRGVCVILINHIAKQSSNTQKVVKPLLQQSYGTGGFAKYCSAVVGVSADFQKKVSYLEALKLDRFNSSGYFSVSLEYDKFRLTEIVESEDSSQATTSQFEDDEGYGDIFG